MAPTADSGLLRRAYGALGELAWAYLSSIADSDWGRSSMFLATFQETYNAYPQALNAGLSERGEAVSAIGLSSRLPVSGGFDSATRLAVGVAVYLHVARVSRVPLSHIAAMPEAAGGLGRWFRQLQDTVPAASQAQLSRLYEETKHLPFEEMRQTVGQHVVGFIEDLPAPGPPSVPRTTTATRPPAMSAGAARAIASGGGAGPIPFGPAQQFYARPPTGRGAPTWVWATGATFGAALLGGLTYLAVKKFRGGRGRRRR